MHVSERFVIAALVPKSHPRRLKPQRSEEPKQREGDLYIQGTQQRARPSSGRTVRRRRVSPSGEGSGREANAGGGHGSVARATRGPNPGRSCLSPRSCFAPRLLISWGGDEAEGAEHPWGGISAFSFLGRCFQLIEQYISPWTVPALFLTVKHGAAEHFQL